jgi:8-oxo-dGTP pyrophosphatase MutT (NUDIX family)
VVGVIHNPENRDEILLQKHKKLEAWNLPGGKGTLEDNPYDVLVRELQEECGIAVADAYLYKHKLITVERDGKKMNVPLYLYIVLKYTGVIKNLQEDKHPIQEFLNAWEKKRRNEPLTQALEYWLEFDYAI